MGGNRSGRSGRPSYESTASIALRTRAFAPIGLRFDILCKASITYHCDGADFPVAITIDTTDRHSPFLELAHRRRTASAERERYRVRLETTDQPFGGTRWWFRCPEPACALYASGCPGVAISSGAGMPMGLATRLSGKTARAAPNCRPRSSMPPWVVTVIGWRVRRPSRNGCVGQPTSGRPQSSTPTTNASMRPGPADSPASWPACPIEIDAVSQMITG